MYEKFFLIKGKRQKLNTVASWQNLCKDYFLCRAFWTYAIGEDVCCLQRVIKKHVQKLCVDRDYLLIRTVILPTRNTSATTTRLSNKSCGIECTTAFAHNMELYLYKRNFENKIGEWCSPEILIQGMLQEPVFEAQTCKVFGAEFEETSLQYLWIRN